MIKKAIKYTNLSGKVVEGEYYFHLPALQVAKLEASRKGGLRSFLKRLAETEDYKEAMEIFEILLTHSYGVRTDDGDFEQTPEILAGFMKNTLLVDALVTELMTNEPAAIEFITGIVPEGFKAEVNVQGTLVQPVKDEPAWIKENRRPTEREIMAMSHEELMEAFKQKTSGTQPVRDSPQA